MIEIADRDASEKLSDTLDIASRNFQVENDYYVEVARRNSAPQGLRDASGKMVSQVLLPDGTYPYPNCVEDDCGDPLPLGRQELGRIRCVTCQAAREPRRR